MIYQSDINVVFLKSVYYSRNALYMNTRVYTDWTSFTQRFVDKSGKREKNRSRIECHQQISQPQALMPEKVTW